MCISSLPTNGWNWLLVPFNPLPVALWRWRRAWGGAFAALLGVFALFVSFMPHRVTEWPYVVFIVAFALLFAKPSLRRAFFGRAHTLPLGRARTPSAPQKGVVP